MKWPELRLRKRSMIFREATEVIHRIDAGIDAEEPVCALGQTPVPLQSPFKNFVTNSSGVGGVI